MKNDGISRIVQWVFAILFFVIITVVLFEETAFAYLDPGTGSMMLQILIGVAVGALATVKIYWGRIKKILPFEMSKKLKKRAK